MRDFKRKLSAYNRARGKRAEVTHEKRVGFFRLVSGKPEWTPRPVLGTPRAFLHRGPFRIGDDYFGASDHGLLVDGAYNRDIRPERVKKYSDAMVRGQWRTLLSDPIAITSDGQVVNGQHRLAALDLLEWDGSDDDGAFQFLVVWDVDPSEAQFADESHRTARDQATIARKLSSC